MMDVQIMRLIVDEVDRDVVPRVAQTAARRWCRDGDVASLVYVRSSANHLFRFACDDSPYYLRLAHDAERRPASLAAELEFVEHVAASGLVVARPVPSTNGAMIEQVSESGQQYFAVAFAELQGSELELDELDAARYRAWGRALALVHRASRTFPLHPERSNWLDELRALLSTLPPNETALAQVLNSGIVWLESFAPPERDYGLIHGDFELDNLIWDGDHFQALDFDDATYAWYAVDFAAALQDVWLAGSEQRDERIQWFLEGYAALRPLPEGLHAALPPLMTLQDAIKMARLLRAYASTTDDNAPAWAGSMRTRHQQWLEAKRKTLVWA